MINKINYIILQCVILFAPLLVLKQVISLLGINSYSNYLSAIIWLQFTFTITDMGLSNAGVKLTAENPNLNPKLLLFLHILLSSLVYFLLINPLVIQTEDSTQLLGQFLYLASMSLLSPWYYNSLNVPQILTLGIFSSRLFFIAAIFLVQNISLSQLWAIQGATYIITSLCLICFTRVNTLRTKPYKYKKILNFALQFAPIRLATYGYVNAPLLIISRFVPEILVQIDFALKLKAVCMAGVTALNQSYFYILFNGDTKPSWKTGVYVNLGVCAISIMLVYITFDYIAQFVNLGSLNFGISFYFVILSIIPISITGPITIYLMRNDAQKRMLYASISTLGATLIICFMMYLNDLFNHIYMLFLISELVFLTLIYSLNNRILRTAKEKSA